MTEQHSPAEYFPHVIPITAAHWRSLDLGALSRLIAEKKIPNIVFYRQLAFRLNTLTPDSPPVLAGHLNLYATLQTVQRYLIDVLAEKESSDVLENAVRRSGTGTALQSAARRFVDQFPPREILSGVTPADFWLAGEPRDMKIKIVLREMLLVRLGSFNPAIESFRMIVDDRHLVETLPEYHTLLAGVAASLAEGPLLPGLGMTLGDALMAPVRSSPDSLSGQVGYIREQWHDLLPEELLEEVTSAFDILLEEERERGWHGEPGGPPPVLEFPRAAAGGGGGGGGGPSPHHDGSSVFGGYDYPEYESFSLDADWMTNVVLMAKMVYVWLDQLGKQYGYPITRLDQIPDAELDRLAGAGFTALWLIGIWERSAASQRIKQISGNPEAIASAYSLYDYEIAEDLGGWEALGSLRERAALRGIRLASDMVPNHTGIYSRWILQHPDWFVQTDYCPFPTYRFNGEDLSMSPDACIQIEDGYWTRSEAAVVFRLIERQTGRIRYIYHGNDGTSIPWNDTAQLNYLLPEVREAVVQTILHVARNFPIIRFDAAMTLAKKHYQRLWYPLRGLGGGIPSRAENGMSREEFDSLFPVEFWREVVDRVAAEVPGTLLLAEAFWLMEGYFVRTLGMHRVYNSAFMNMLKTEENQKYRQTIKNVLEFNPEILKRFVNFMNNPDEKTAVEQFGTQGKYFGACTMMVTMPGLPMFGHGQVEGLHEKYGMEYRRAYWNEPVDQGLVAGHEMWIFPLIRRRWLFSESENFVLYDFQAGDHVNENVFAYSNRAGNQRALVLYHNCYATTAGWIRESAAFAVKGDNGETTLRRTTLADALDIDSDEGLFYGFRDVANGLSYLRQGRELRTKGLYAELGEYEFAVFLDFREIRDDLEGTWSALCKKLEGRGCASLEEERLQVRYAELNRAFSEVIELPLADLEEPSASGRTTPRGGATTAAKVFLGLLERQEPGQVIPVPSLKELVVTSPDGRKKKEEDWSEEFQLLSEQIASVAGRVLFSAWRVMRDVPAGMLAAYGLDCTFRRLIEREGASECLGLPPHACVKLLEALLEKIPSSPADSDPFEGALSGAACREFIGVHESGGEVWFNKERFEQLLQWRLSLACLASCDGLPGTWDLAQAEYVRYSRLAAEAGYRFNLFLRLLTVKKPVEAAQKRDVGPTGKQKKQLV